MQQVAKQPKKPKQQPKIIGAQEALQVWGMRSQGGRLQYPRAKGYDRRTALEIDDEMSLVIYVEETPGFVKAQPALALRYVHGKKLTERTHKIRARLFELKLSQRLRQTPWYPPRPIERLCGAELADKLAEAANAELRIATRDLFGVRPPTISVVAT